MIYNNYNYILNGIVHETPLNSSIKFESEPLEQKYLITNKYFIKIINDLFDYLSIEYTIIKNTLLGQKIFNGVNIFEEFNEFLIEKNNIKKLLKEKDYLKSNYIDLHFIDEKYFLLETRIFNELKTYAYIYIFDVDNDIVTFCDKTNQVFNFKFYDVYPIQKNKFEEFEVSVPNKIDIVLKQTGIKLDYLILKSNKMIVKKFMEEKTFVFCLINYLVFLYKIENDSYTF